MQEDGVVLVYGLHGDFRRHFSMGNVGGPGGWGKGMESGTLSLPQPTTPLSRRCSRTGFWMPGSSILSLVLGWPSSQELTASPSVPTWVTSNSAGCQRCQVSLDTPGAAFTAHKCASCPWDHQRQKLDFGQSKVVLFHDHRSAECTLMLDHSVPGPSGAHSPGCRT